MSSRSLTSAQMRGFQTVWFILAFIVLALYILAVPAFMDDISSRVGSSSQPFNIPLTNEQVAAVSSIGLTRFVYAGWIVVIGLMVGITYWLVAFVVFGSNRTNWVIGIATLMMITYIATEVAVLESLKDAPAPWDQIAWVVIEVIQAVGEVLSLVVYFIFPDGHFRPRWTRIVAIGYTTFVALCLIFPSFPFNVLNGDVFDQTPLLSALLALAWHLTGVYALIYKYKRELDHDTVAQTKWFAIGLLFAFFASALRYIIPGLIEDSAMLHSPSAQVIYKMLLRPTQWLLLLVMPISLGITQIVGNASIARKRAETLQRERENLVVKREEVLNKISNDVHDDLLPDINLEIFRLDRAIGHLPGDSSQTRILIEESKQQLRDVMMRLRQLTHEWRPPLLDQLGLIEAIRAEAVSASGEHGNDGMRLSVLVTVPETPISLSPAIETTAYRIIREALRNVVTHAQASHCSIVIALDGQKKQLLSSEADHTLVIQVRDDGIGIHPSHTPGKGLGSMRQRAEEIGGILEWHSESVLGTVITAYLPLVSGRRNTNGNNGRTVADD